MVTCPNCMERIEGEAAFCPSCGTPLASAAPAAQPPPAQPTAPPAPAPAMAGVVVPPAPFVPEGGPGSTEVASTRRPRRGVGRSMLVGVVVLVVVGTGALVAVRILRAARGGSGGGGASRPAGAVSGVFKAIDGEDYAGVASYLAPDEVPDVSKLISSVRGRAKAFGFTAADDAAVVDISSSLEAGDPEELGKSVAKVPVTGGLSMKGGGKGWGPLLSGIADTSGTANLQLSGVNVVDKSGRRVKPFVMTVKIDGRWFLSPMLTVAEYVRIAQDLPKGDFDVATSKGAASKTPKALFNQLAQAVTERDVAAAATTLSSGERRVMLVYEAAAKSLLKRIPQGDTFTVDDVSVKEVKTPSGTGAVVTSIEGTARATRQQQTPWSFDGSCIVRPQRGPSCVLPEGEDAKRVGLQQPAVELVKERGAWRIAPARTVIALANRFVAAVDRPTLLDMLGMQVLDDPKPITVETPVDVDYGKKPYAVFELSLAAGAIAHTSGTDVSYDTYVQADDGRWVRGHDGDSDKKSTTMVANDVVWSRAPKNVRFVVVPERRSCSWGCALHVVEDAGTPTITARSVAQEVGPFPGTFQASGTPKAFRVTVPTNTAAALVGRGSGSATLYAIDGKYTAGASGNRAVPIAVGEYLLFVRPASSGNYSVTLGPPAGGFEGGAASTNVKVSSAAPEARVTLHLLKGKSWTVRATPDQGLDVSLQVLDVNGSTVVCQANSSAAGRAESCAFPPSPNDGDVTVIVRRQNNLNGGVTVAVDFG